ncbi:MAG TPA: DUF3054 domain-containing protein [Anaerolineales bacterium]
MKTSLVLVGDLLAIALVTLIGFATHGEAVAAFVPRMAVLYLPLALAWLVLAPSLNLFKREVISDPKQLWRAGLAMLFAAPAAVIVRGLLLNAPIVPIFGLVLSSVSALGMLVWRALVFFLSRPRKA